MSLIRQLTLWLLILTSTRVEYRSMALRTDDGSDPLVPDYNPLYYYSSITTKMTESMSINNCTLYGADLSTSKYVGGAESKEKADLVARVVYPPAPVKRLWGKQNQGSFEFRLFTKANMNLCLSDRFEFFREGSFRRAKGCFKSIVKDRKGNAHKLINRYGATLHPDHIRCDLESSVRVCYTADRNYVVNETEIVEVPAKFRYIHANPFVVTAKNVIIARSGMIALPCGPFGLLAQCEAVKWGLSSVASTLGYVADCRRNPDTCPFKRVKKVFILTQYDDTQIGQFMMETFPKLVYHYEYMKNNPDILIHFGFTKKPVLPNITLPHNFLNWLGLGNRLINGTYYADEVIIAREGGCQDAGYNAWEILSMRERFFNMIGLPSDSQPRNAPPSIVILIRNMKSKFMQNRSDALIRSYPPGFLEQFIKILKKQYPTHNIELFSDINSTLMTCPPCQIEMFRHADLAIGFHGAGLSNTMYMRPGGVVVELIPLYDSRHAPVTGIFPRLTSIIGLHHYSFYAKDIVLRADTFANDVYDFYTKVKAMSKLKSSLIS